METSSQPVSPLRQRMLECSGKDAIGAGAAQDPRHLEQAGGCPPDRLRRQSQAPDRVGIGIRHRIAGQ